jgi:hypothetical protein
MVEAFSWGAAVSLRLKARHKTVHVAPLLTLNGRRADGKFLFQVKFPAQSAFLHEFATKILDRLSVVR